MTTEPATTISVDGFHVYHDPTWIETHTLFVAGIGPRHNLLPPAAVPALGDAHFEFTDYGAHLPAQWLDYKPTGDDIGENGQQLLERIETLLTQLTAASPNLATTLRYHRSRDHVRIALDDLDDLGHDEAIRQAAARTQGWKIHQANNPIDPAPPTIPHHDAGTQR